MKTSIEKIMIGLVLSLASLVATTGMSDQVRIANALECSVNKHYTVWIRVSDKDPNKFEASFWRWGFINLGPDQKHIPTVIDQSDSFQVVREEAGLRTIFEANGFRLSVAGDITLPKRNPPLDSERGSLMAYKATLNASTHLISDMGDQENVQIRDCTYNTL
jgi:hypothetical protein